MGHLRSFVFAPLVFLTTREKRPDQLVPPHVVQLAFSEPCGCFLWCEFSVGSTCPLIDKPRWCRAHAGSEHHHHQLFSPYIFLIAVWCRPNVIETVPSFPRMSHSA